jgi:hypothetical protein
MANNIASNPLIIDTPGPGLITEKRLIILDIRWVGATTAGHQCVITDSQDVVKWVSVADAVNFVDDCNPGGFEGTFWDGLKVPIMGSGVLYLTIS